MIELMPKVPFERLMYLIKESLELYPKEIYSGVFEVQKGIYANFKGMAKLLYENSDDNENNRCIDT